MSTLTNATLAHPATAIRLGAATYAGSAELAEQTVRFRATQHDMTVHEIVSCEARVLSGMRGYEVTLIASPSQPAESSGRYPGGFWPAIAKAA